MGRPMGAKETQPPHFTKGPGRATLQASPPLKLSQKQGYFWQKFSIFLSFFCKFFFENKFRGAARRAAHPGPAMRRALDGPPDRRKENTASTFYEGPWTGRPPGGCNDSNSPKNGTLFGKIFQIFLPNFFSPSGGPSRARCETGSGWAARRAQRKHSLHIL